MRRLAWSSGLCWEARIFAMVTRPSLLVPAWTSDVEAVAKLITAFLELHRLESPVELSQSSNSEADGPGRPELTSMAPLSRALMGPRQD